MSRGLLYTSHLVSVFLLAPGVNAVALARLLQQPTGSRSRSRVSIRPRGRPKAASFLLPSSRGLAL